MEAPRRTVSIGPVTISVRRGERDDVAHIGPVASPLVHLIVLILAILFTSSRAQKQRAEEIAKASTPPVTVTFVTPFKPPPPPQPKVAPQPKVTPRELTFRRDDTFPPPSTKKLLMQPVPERSTAQKPTTKPPSHEDAGPKDTRPAAGEEGGPEPKPTAGAPDPGSLGRDAQGDPSLSATSDQDLDARLRSFKRAIEAPRPPAPKSHRGGGGGTGGLVMPDMPGLGFGVGNLQFEGNDYDWDDYGQEIYWAIKRAWYRRLLADAGVFERWSFERRISDLDHTSGVRFTILRSGQVVDVLVETASGCRPLDDSATEALQEVVLPPLPEDFKRESETVHAHFIAEGQIQGMRQQLEFWHSRGAF